MVKTAWMRGHSTLGRVRTDSSRLRSSKKLNRKENSMRIKKISALAFKGKSFQHELAPITAICGMSMAGKSSVAEAVTLSIAGFLSGIEKPGKAIHNRLASGQIMSVRSDFDDGRFIGREYSENAKGAVSTKVTHRGLSDSWAVSPALVDPTEFLAMSGDKRVKFLFSKLIFEGEFVTPAVLLERLGKLIQKLPDENRSPEQDTYVKEMSEEIIDDHENSVRAGLTPQAWLEGLVFTTGEKLKSARERDKAVQQSWTAMPFSSVKDAPKNRAAVKERLEKARLALRAAQDTAASTSSILTQKGAQRAQGEQGQADLAAYDTQKARLAELNAKLPELAKVKGKAEPPKPEPEILAYQAVKQETVEIRSAMNAAKTARDLAVKELAEVDGLECCPYCQAKNKGWKEKIRPVIQTKLEVVQKELEIASVTLNNTVTAEVEAQKKSDTAIKAYNDWQTEFNAFEKAMQEIGRLEVELSKVAMMQGQVDALPALIEEITKLKTEQTAQKEIVRLAEAEFASAKADDDKFIALDAEEAQRQAAAAKSKQANMEVEVLKLFAGIAQDVLDVSVQKGIKPFVEKVNALCKDLLPFPIAYENQELGMRRDDVFTSWKSFSSSEKLLFYHGVCIALASESELKLAVIDCAEMLDFNARPKLLNRLKELIASGIIEQAVIVSVLTEASSLAFWKEFETANPDLAKIIIVN
jgi:hypothetical protein